MADILTVTNNEDYVRLRIFEGEIPLSEAGHELVRLATEQLRHERLRHDETRALLVKVLREASIRPNG